MTQHIALPVVWRGAWASHAHYDAGNLVTDAGAVYVAQHPVRGTTHPAADSTHWALAAGAGSGQALYGPATFDHATASNNDTVTLYTPAAGDVLLRLFADPATTAAWDFGEVRAMVASTELANTHSTIDVTTPYVFTDTTPLNTVYSIGGTDTSGTGHSDIYALIARPVAP